MNSTTIWVCCTILISFALTIVGYPENSLRSEVENIPEYSYTAQQLLPSQFEQNPGFPVYNPTLAFQQDESQRVKRHLFKKKKAKKGGQYYQQSQQPPVIIINEYHGGKGGHHGGYDGGHHIQPRYPQYEYPGQNHGWGR